MIGGNPLKKYIKLSVEINLNAWYLLLLRVAVSSGLGCSKLDCAIHRVNLYSVDSAMSFPNTYPLDIDLSGG